MVGQKSFDPVPPPHLSAKYSFIGCLFSLVKRFLCIVNLASFYQLFVLSTFYGVPFYGSQPS